MMPITWKKPNGHTKGPWEAVRHRICAEDEGFAPLALVQEQPRHEVMIANARLIAAAPELLAALEEAIPLVKELWQKNSDDRGEEIWGQFERMSAAYAKATTGGA